MRPPPPLAAPVASSRSPPPPFCPALRFPPPRFGRRAASQAIGQLPERRPIRIRLRLPRQRLSLGRPPLLHLLGTTLRVAADALAVSLTLARVPIPWRTLASAWRFQGAHTRAAPAATAARSQPAQIGRAHV